MESSRGLVRFSTVRARREAGGEGAASAAVEAQDWRESQREAEA